MGVYITKNKRAKLRSYQIILRTVILPDGRLHTHSQYQLLFDKVFLKLVCFPTPPIWKPNCMLVRYSHNPGSFLERVFNISRTLWTSVVSKNIFLGTSGISTLTASNTWSTYLVASNTWAIWRHLKFSNNLIFLQTISFYALLTIKFIFLFTQFEYFKNGWAILAIYAC